MRSVTISFPFTKKSIVVSKYFDNIDIKSIDAPLTPLSILLTVSTVTPKSFAICSCVTPFFKRNSLILSPLSLMLYIFPLFPADNRKKGLYHLHKKRRKGKPTLIGYLSPASLVLSHCHTVPPLSGGALIYFLYLEHSVVRLFN